MNYDCPNQIAKELKKQGWEPLISNNRWSNPKYGIVDVGWWDAVSIQIEKNKIRNKYDIGDILTDENGNIGIVVIKWNDGDICDFENDAAHYDPRVLPKEEIPIIYKKRMENKT